MVTQAAVDSAIVVIIIWGVSPSRQQSRCYVAVEDKGALKIRHKERESSVLLCKGGKKEPKERVVE